jgi:predicted regulator of Ras-like GTPase activity (Roadblock/LC7/MglB family)
MNDILKDIDSVNGVTGSFVCGGEGRLLARTLPAVTGDGALEATGRILLQTLNGLESSRTKKVSELEFHFEQGALLVKNLGAAVLCIVCGQKVNVPLLNLTANLAVKQLRKVMTEVPASAPPAPAGPPAGADVLGKIEHELARAIGPVAGLSMDDALRARRATRETLSAAALRELVGALEAEISDDARRTRFRQAVDPIVKSAGG